MAHFGELRIGRSGNSRLRRVVASARPTGKAHSSTALARDGFFELLAGGSWVTEAGFRVAPRTGFAFFQACGDHLVATPRVRLRAIGPMQRWDAELDPQPA